MPIDLTVFNGINPGDKGEPDGRSALPRSPRNLPNAFYARQRGQQQRYGTLRTQHICGDKNRWDSSHASHADPKAT